MAAPTLTSTEIALSEMLGRPAVMRARRLVRSGRVTQIRARSSSGVVRGLVSDGPHDYQAMAVIRRRRGGATEVGAWSCDCEDESCPHAAAVVLAHEKVPVTSKSSSAPAVKPLAPWQTALTGVLSSQGADREHPTAPHDGVQASGRPPVALQFEVLTGHRFQLSVRLVMPGRNGTWVRGNLSWISVAHPQHELRQVTSGQRRLLKELHNLPSAHQVGWQDKYLFLDAIVSRRLWDLLGELQEAGVPLVMTGTRAEPVHLHTEPIAARLLVHRQEAGLVLEPALESGGHRVTGSYLPISNPPHGVAWVPSDGRGLRLARLGAAPPQIFWQLSRTQIPPIPAADEETFLAEFYPQLSRQVEVVSPDGSVALPQAQPPVLQLTVTPLGEHRLALDWAWSYRIGQTQRQEPLLPRAGEPSTGRSISAENQILAEIAPLLRDVPETLQDTGGGVIPAPRSLIEGMASARLMSLVIPQLTERTDVAVQIALADGMPEYRQAEDEPVLEFTADDGGDRDWLDLAVTVTIDGQPVPFEQLFVALAQDLPELLLDNGLWFSLDRPEFHRLAALIAESRQLLDAPAATVRLSRFHASVWDEIETLGVIHGEVEQWRDSIRALSAAADLPDAKLPAGLEATLRPYQDDGFRWLATLFAHRLGGVLADEMGLGKTLQTLALFLHAREQGLTGHPFLVVAPTSVVANWEQEAHRFIPDFTVAAITATGPRRGRDVADAIDGADLVITSYTLFRLEFDQYQEQEWAGLVLDEAQSVKNHQAAGYRCACELPARFKLAITGTPMENNLMELWALFSIVAPGLFPRPERFTEYYRTPIEREQDADKLGQLRRRITPLLLRRTKDLVAGDLPDRQEQILELDLLPRQRKIYQKYLQRERQKVLGLLGDMNRNRFEIFRSLTLLRQAALDVSLIDPAHESVPSTKLDALLEQLPQIAAEGHRVLVFSQFTRLLGRAAERLDENGIEYCYLDGKTKNRARVISTFRKGSAPVFLISLKAGGSGLNLTEADYVFLLDPWWNPAVEAQAVDRAHRIGQTRHVMVYRMVARNTIEEKVMALKARKQALTESILDGDEMGSSALTAQDIRHLLD